ncbi:nucleotide exchange factor GrpE [Parachlamydia sp. AcF125]|uniref:nucleotide exchange factor GrpE n=1 Tax=Parachlamydia sp. AcF125 TaxID=2795736 RepID=UPI001BC96085|nr:nucleotide exchange factor GrpE [Parachlamydia sp. AcF125]MBS4168203.1 Protein GrpE [Parachlamydia sp. AcF125]
MTKADNKNHEKDQSEMDKVNAECMCSHECTPAQEGEVKPQPNVVSIEEKEIEALRRDAADNKDKYLRVLAEAENQRKRLQKERQELIQYALQNVIADFLNPIDQMENALKFKDQMSAEVKGWALGFEMILNQFKDVLATNGVAPMVSVGTSFDPHLHEAIEMVETGEFAPGTVVEESLKGYKMGERVIRPARVKVAKAVSEPAPEQTE